MRRLFRTRIASTVAVIFVAIFSVSGAGYAADPPIDVEALQAELETAKQLLEKDKANHQAMAEKKRLVDEKLAAKKEHEAKIFEELKTLCEEQDKLEPGSLDSCMAKVSD